MNYSLENIYKERVFDFYKNRFLRIYPQLIFAMITTLFVHCIVSQYIAGNSINIGQEFKGLNPLQPKIWHFVCSKHLFLCGKLFIILLLSILLT